LYSVRLINGLFRLFDHYDAVIVRWMCAGRIRGRSWHRAKLRKCPLM